MSDVVKEKNVRTDLVPQVDVLVPTKPMESFLSKSPDYVFQVNDLRSLIQKKTELMGKEFPLPECNFSAQIKCVVKYDEFQLFIRFLDPEKIGQPMEMGMKTVKLVIVIKNQNKVHSDQILRPEVPFNSQLVYGRFSPPCILSFDKNIKNLYDYSENSITLHLHVRMVAAKNVFLEDGVFLWMMDVSRGQLPFVAGSVTSVRVLGLSPFLHVHPDGMRVQIRLFVRNDGMCHVEARIVNESRSSTSNVIHIHVIHPTDSTRPMLTSSFDFGNHDRHVLSRPRFSFKKVFAVQHELLQYVSDSKLLAKVEIK